MLLYWLFNILMKDPISFLFVITVLFIPLLLSITVHEWAHGVVAYKFGDPTPEQQGRLSFNPLNHLDPLGTLMIFIVGIGWAKPVMINPNNIDSKYKLMLVALAGPLSNIIMAILFTLVLYFALLNPVEHSFYKLGISLLVQLGKINLVLAFFNLMPIPPLDGYNILRTFLPDAIVQMYDKLAPYGMLALVVLLYTIGFDFIFDTAKKAQEILFAFINSIFKLL